MPSRAVIRSVPHTTDAIVASLQVADTIFDPFGDDAEDFAILHFVEQTAKESYEAMHCEGHKPSKKYVEEWEAKEQQRMSSINDEDAGLHTDGEAEGTRGSTAVDSHDSVTLPSASSDAKVA